MKRLILIMLVLLTFFPSARLWAANDVKLGMTVYDFRQIHPDMPSQPTIQWTKPAIYFDIQGHWTYHFTQGVLDWYQFIAVADPPTKEAFDQFLQVSRKIEGSLRRSYGSPQKSDKEDSEYKDPFYDHHWGYTVLHSTWREYNSDVDFSYRFKGAFEYYRLEIEVLVKKR